MLQVNFSYAFVPIDVSEISATEASEEKARRPTASRPHKLTKKATKVPLISDTSIYSVCVSLYFHMYFSLSQGSHPSGES